MPTYEYRCRQCGHDFEVVQSFSDAPLTECPVCGSELRKVFSPVGVVLKGSGFYRTDSRARGNGKDAKKKVDATAGSDSSSSKGAESAPASSSSSSGSDSGSSSSSSTSTS